MTPCIYLYNQSILYHCYNVMFNFTNNFDDLFQKANSTVSMK